MIVEEHGMSFWTRVRFPPGPLSKQRGCKRLLKSKIGSTLTYVSMDSIFISIYKSKGYSESAPLLPHNLIATSWLIRWGLNPAWYKQVPTHHLCLSGIEVGDFLDEVKLYPRYSENASCFYKYFFSVLMINVDILMSLVPIFLLAHILLYHAQ